MRTTYRRTNGGRTVHLGTCRYAQVAIPWIWAEGMPPTYVALTCDVHGIEPCKVCKPFGGAS